MRCGAVVEIFNLVGKVFYVLWNAVWAVFRCLTGVVIGILAVAIIVFGFLVSPLVVPLRLWQISRESKVWAEEFSRRSSRG